MATWRQSCGIALCQNQFHHILIADCPRLQGNMINFDGWGKKPSLLEKKNNIQSQEIHIKCFRLYIKIGYMTPIYSFTFVIFEFFNIPIRKSERLILVSFLLNILDLTRNRKWWCQIEVKKMKHLLIHHWFKLWFTSIIQKNNNRRTEWEMSEQLFDLGSIKLEWKWMRWIRIDIKMSVWQ